MKDKRGLYYYPFPLNKRVRMYVREVEGAICFRLWNADDPELWKEHGWVPHGAIKQAAVLSRSKPRAFDPNQAYDLDVAEMLLKQGG